MDLRNFLESEHSQIILMILILLFSILLGWMVKKVMRLIYKNITAKRKRDPGKFILWIFVLRLIIIVVGISYAITLDPHIESATTSLLASAGLVTAIVGFAAKDTLSNMVSGAVIIIFRPFTLSHWIKVGSVSEGTVEEIKMLYTVIKEPTNRRLIIPNSKILSSDVINSSYREEAVLQIVEFGISYESDIDKAKEIIRKVAEASPLSIDKRTEAQQKNNDPIVKVQLAKFGAYSIELHALVWVNNAREAILAKWVFNEEVRKRFDEAGVEIPYPNVVIRSEYESKL